MKVIENHQVLINALKDVLSGNIMQIQAPQKDFIDSNEARQYLGVSKSSLFKYTHHNIVPYYKVRGKLWFKKEELEQFISQSRVKSIYELQNEAEKSLNLNRKHR